jgi:uncharacterized membrane protein YraQ (UPF0718 family)
LVIELGIIMPLLLGWQFTLGEFVGGPLMIVLMALVFRIFLNRGLVEEAREQPGRMEGHAEMDMSVHERGPLWRRLTSPRGFTATANYFVMDWAAIWIDIFGGLSIAGALAAWVPDSWWQSLFLENHDTLAKFWGALIGPLVAIRQLRLLDRQRAARGRALERRHQLRRCARVYLRRPDRAPDP